MILLKSIHLYKFLSHDDTKVLFTPTQKLLINGDSGAGKSSISDALIWAIYGKARCDNRSLIKKGNPVARVVLNITDGDAEYKIDRSITKAGKHEVSLSEKNPDGSFSPSKVSGIKNIQDYVENRIIKASYLLFINSIAYPQDNGENFINQTAERRKDIILEIAKASDYDNYYEVARDTAKERYNETLMLKASISEKTALINEVSKNVIDVEPLKGEIIEIDKKIFELNKEIAKGEENEKTRQTLNTEKEKLEVEMMMLAAQKKAMEVEINRVAEELQKVANIDIEDLKKKDERYKEVDNQLELLSIETKRETDWKMKQQQFKYQIDSIRDLFPDIAELTESIKKEMDKTADICPESGKPCCIFAKRQEGIILSLQQKIEEKNLLQTVNLNQKKTIEEAIKKLGPCPLVDVDKIKALSEERKSTASAAADLWAAKNTLEKRDLLAQGVEISKGRMNSLLESENAAKAKYDAILPLLQALPASLLVSELRNQKSFLESRVFELKAKIGRSEENAVLLEKTRKGTEEIEASIKQKEEDIDNLTVLKEAFSSTGIKSMVIDSIVPALEVKINEVLSKLSDFRVSLETQKSSVAGDKTLEGLFITVTNGQNESFDLANYSGGEKVKINHAISEGLASLQKTGFRFYDESIIGLDDNTIESFAEVIMAIKEKVSQVFCISHLNRIKELFSDQIKIVKERGTSKISN